MMSKSYSILILLILSFNTLMAQKQLSDPVQKKYDLYLLIGQSNMAGRGEIVEEDKIPLDNVFYLNKQLIWMKAADPIHFDKPSAGVGLAKTFGKEMSNNYPEKTIGLIPCAVGGTSIDLWQPGIMDEKTISYPWDNMLERLKFALQFGELKGILWHQGESDSTPEKCLDYKEKLIDLIKRVRDEAGDENIPFVAGELGKFFVKQNKEKYPDMKNCPACLIVKSTKELSREIPNTGFVVSNALESDGGDVHFNSEGYRELGKRYANMMIRIQNY